MLRGGKRKRERNEDGDEDIGGVELETGASRIKK